MNIWDFPIKDLSLRRAVSAKRDMCPECGGDLDTGWECNKCDYDAMDEAKSVSNCDIFKMICHEGKFEKPAIEHPHWWLK